MSFKYLALIAAISPSLMYAIKVVDMDSKNNSSTQSTGMFYVPENQQSSDKKKQEIKHRSQAHKQVISRAISKKNHDIAVTHISSLVVPITFHGRTRQFYQWLNDEKSSFGLTPIVLCKAEDFTSRGRINECNDINSLEGLAIQDALYISNTHKVYIAEKKYIWLGTLVLGDVYYQGDSKKTEDKILKLTNQFLLHHIISSKKVNVNPS